MSLAPGSTFGPFKIIEPLGRGGMASVFKAYEPGLDRYVALKVLPVESVQDEASAERFRREARVIARLEHPNITPIHSFGIDEATHVPWMAMRLISGGTLSNRLTMRLTPPRAVSILRGVADALDYAHGKGVMHRDVKPANILLDEHGRVYLADFGIARLVEGATALTAAGLISGTPSYMAPEQATGAALDHRLDIYALGVVAYEALAGKVPFPGDNPIEVLMKHVQAPVPDAPDLPDEVMAALEKALAKKPEDRWESAGALVGALETAIASMPEVSTRPTDPGMTSVLTASRPAPTGAAARATAVPYADPATAAPPAPVTRVARTRAAAGATASAGPTVLSPAPAVPEAERRGTGLALIAGGAALFLFIAAMGAFIVLRARTAPGPGEPAASTAAAGAPTLVPAPLPSARVEPSAAPNAGAVAPGATVDRAGALPATVPAATPPPHTLPPVEHAPPPTRAAVVAPPAVTVPPTTAAPAPAANGVVRLDVVAVQPAFGAMSASVAIDVAVDGHPAQSVALRFDGTTAFARSRRRQTYEIGGVPAGRRTVSVVVRPDGGGLPMRAATEMDVTPGGSTAILDVRLRGNGEGDVKFR